MPADEQTKSNWLGVNYDGVRETFYTELIQVTYGISKNKRFNIGLDINLKASARASNEEVKGILRPPDFQNNDFSNNNDFLQSFKSKYGENERIY